MTELGLNPDAHSTLEDLQTLHTLHIESEKQRKKDEAAVKKFRKQLDDLILKHPDAGIKNVPNDAGPNTLETAVKNARDARDLFKKEQKELEKLTKAQERANKKAADDKKKIEEKAKKLANKAAGVKGVKKNGLYQAFTAWITDELPPVISTNLLLMKPVVRANTILSNGRKCPNPRRRIHRLLGTKLLPKFLSPS